MTAKPDTLLVETIARHFPEAKVEDNEIDLGFGGLWLSCAVSAVRKLGPYVSASLFFRLRGGRLAAPVFASISGYAETAEEAIVTGGCHWACSFGPVLRTGLAGEARPEVASFELSVGGQPFRVFVDKLDRGFSFTTGEDIAGRVRSARTQLKLNTSPWLVSRVLESGLLPVLSAERPTVLSVFISEVAPERVVEVKVNGFDWPGMHEAFANAGPGAEGPTVLLRELAVLVPLGAPAELRRGALQRTLEGLQRKIGDQEREAVRWRGFRQHGGRLAPALAPEEVSRLEQALGLSLPEDYRRFLLEVAAAGAGPGYGLLSPLGEAQRELAGGRFSWTDGKASQGPPAGVLALAHAGCGVMWVLVLEGRHRGEVWLDAASSDKKARRVAASFNAWYRDWLGSAISNDVPWCPWDARCCSTPAALSNFLDALEQEGPIPEAPLAGRLGPGALSLKGGGSAYFQPGAPLNPCHACVTLVRELGGEEKVFAPGGAPRQAPGGAPPAGGIFSQVGRRFGWGSNG